MLRYILVLPMCVGRGKSQEIGKAFAFLREKTQGSRSHRIEINNETVWYNGVDCGFAESRRCGYHFGRNVSIVGGSYRAEKEARSGSRTSTGTFESLSRRLVAIIVTRKISHLTLTWPSAMQTSSGVLQHLTSRCETRRGLIWLGAAIKSKVATATWRAL